MVLSRSGSSEPVILVGALRSGTTLFRLMLGSHPDLSNPDETDFMFDHLNKTPNGWIYNFDALNLDRTYLNQNLSLRNGANAQEVASDFISQWKQRAGGRTIVLVIHRNIDRALALFPDAKVIHLLRDPRDVAKSCIGMGWAGNTYYGVDQWIDTETNWDESSGLFDHADPFEIRFEDLILNPKQQLEDICRFLGIAFSPAMLEYPNHSTYGTPDASAVQPWRSKLSPREVALVEIKTQKLLLSRNYPLSGNPLKPPSLAERLSLFLTNKIFRWRFACQRYGLFNFVMEAITRRVNRSLHAIFVRRIDVIATKHLK
jgi:hypothetical protein